MLRTFFQSLGVQYDIEHYNTLLEIYIQNEYPFNLEEIIKELEAKGLSPNADTYSCFIAKYSHEGDLQNVNRLLRQMRENSVPIQADVYRSLISCYAKNEWVSLMN